MENNEEITISEDEIINDILELDKNKTLKSSPIKFHYKNSNIKSIIPKSVKKDNLNLIESNNKTIKKTKCNKKKTILNQYLDICPSYELYSEERLRYELKQFGIKFTGKSNQMVNQLREIHNYLKNNELPKKIENELKLKLKLKKTTDNIANFKESIKELNNNTQLISPKIYFNNSSQYMSLNKNISNNSSKIYDKININNKYINEYNTNTLDNFIEDEIDSNTYLDIYRCNDSYTQDVNYSIIECLPNNIEKTQDFDTKHIIVNSDSFEKNNSNYNEFSLFNTLN